MEGYCTVGMIYATIVVGKTLLYGFIQQARRESMELSIQERLKDLYVERGLTLEQNPNPRRGRKQRIISKIWRKNQWE